MIHPDSRADLRALHTFAVTVEQGTFHKAAEKLNKGQPAITRRIQKLEEYLGGAVFDPEQRHVLTPLGEMILGEAQRLLRDYDEMLRKALDPATLAGTFNLGVAETIVQTWLPRFLPHVHATCPRHTLVLDVDISAHLKTRLLARQLDLAFLVGPIDDDELHSRLLTRDKMTFVAAPGVDLPPSATLEELARVALITFPRNTRPYRNLRDLFIGTKTPPIIHASASVTAIVKMALDGLGVAFLPRSTVGQELRHGRLIEIGCDAGVADLEFYASWSARARVGRIEELVSRAVAVAAEHQKDALA